MIPSNKTPQMEVFLNQTTQSLFGRSRTDSILCEVCVTCGGNASAFRDDISRKEFTISGMCQACQDSVFGD